MSVAPLPLGATTIGVLLPSWVGDAVMATGAVRAIRAARPEARIVALARPAPAALLDGAPFLDAVIVADARGATGPLRAARALRAAGVTAVLLLPNSFRAALVARLSGARVIVGHARDGRGLLLTHGLRGDRAVRPKPTILHYAELVAYALGLPAIDARPCLAATEAERARAGSLLPHRCGPLVILVPGGVRAAKRWPAERFVALGAALVARAGARIALVGAPEERALVASIAAGIGGDAVDLAAAGADLAMVKGAIAAADLLVGNDTGPRHVAIALGVPTVVLFGPTDHRWTTIEGAREHRLLAAPFLPEGQVADDHPEACRIDRIPVADAIEASLAALAAPAVPG